MTQRDSKQPSADGAFCWQSKAALRRIRERCGPTLDHQSNRIPTSLAVYGALTEIASNCQSSVFKAPLNEISGACGLSDKTTSKTLELLAEAEVIGIQKPKLRAPASITLLACRSEPISERSEDHNRPTLPYSNKEEVEDEEYFAEAIGAEEVLSKISKQEQEALFKAVCEVCGVESAEEERIPQRVRKVINTLRKMTPELSTAQVRQRSAIYLKKFPTSSLTPEALAKHWSSLEPPRHTIKCLNS
jgi:hypothetical protein